MFISNFGQSEFIQNWIDKKRIFEGKQNCSVGH